MDDVIYPSVWMRAIILGWLEFRVEYHGSQKVEHDAVGLEFWALPVQDLLAPFSTHL